MFKLKSSVFFWLIVIICLSIINWTSDDLHSNNPLLSEEIHWPLIPLNESHPLLKTYGDWNGFVVYVDTIGDSAEIGFHSGVDIPGNLGDSVYSVKAGVVSGRDESGDTFDIYIIISDDSLSKSGWLYSHLDYIPDSLTPGVAIADSQYLGILTDFGKDSLTINDHLHFQLGDSSRRNVHGYDNPLKFLNPTPTQKPEIYTDTLGNPLIYFVQDKYEDTTINRNDTL
jgi:hypothetical protein